MSDLHRLPNEDYYHYIWRVDGLIREGKYKDWSTITPIVNKQLYDDEDDYKTESTFRKKCKYARQFYESGVFDKYSNDEYLKELEEKKDGLKTERYKLQATKLELDRTKRQISRFELFYENIASAIQRLEPPKFTRSTIETNDKEYVLGIGDIHYGATFESKNNKYSREECKRRFEYLANYMIDYAEKNDITKLKIINVADTIQGILRYTDLQINDIPVVECVVEISRIIATFLNTISSVCDVEYYHVPNANHSQTRPLGSKASEIATEDMEKIIVNYISDLLRDNSKVSVISDTSIDYVDLKIFDFECFATHGHQIKNQKESIKNYSNLHRKFYSYAFLGHTHSATETIVGEEQYNNMEVLVIPSFIGSDPYADSLCVGSKAMAKIFEFDKVYGHVASRNIILN